MKQENVAQSKRTILPDATKKIDAQIEAEKEIAVINEGVEYNGQSKGEVADKQKRELMIIPIELIKPGKRLRTLLDQQISAMAENVDLNGLLVPVLVRRHPTTKGIYELIDGMCRLQATKLLGKNSVDAFVVDMTDDEVALAEIDSNLARGTLTILQQAEHLTARQTVYLRLYPNTGHGGDFRKKSKTTNVTFCTTTASELNVEKRTIERLLEIGKNIPEKYRVKLHAKHSIAQNMSGLKAFADFTKNHDDEAQAAVIKMALNCGKKETLKTAIAKWKKANNPEGEALEFTDTDFEKIFKKVSVLFDKIPNTHKPDFYAKMGIVPECEVIQKDDMHKGLLKGQALSDRLRLLREALGLTIEDVARTVELPVATWSKIESGKPEPTADEANAFLPLIFEVDGIARMDKTKKVAA
ncbi:MAG: ParB N-terminal domain-containing protein [Nitrospinae bacterium]|nr:ParB N-terminal domain-containing protein [Nitrospinota bacterium]